MLMLSLHIVSSEEPRWVGIILLIHVALIHVILVHVALIHVVIIIYRISILIDGTVPGGIVGGIGVGIGVGIILGVPPEPNHFH